MTYDICALNDAANDIQRELADLELKKAHGINPFQRTPNFITDGKPDCDTALDAVIGKLRDALVTVRKAEIYVRHFEAFSECEESPVNFSDQVGSEIDECERRNGVK